MLLCRQHEIPVNKNATVTKRNGKTFRLVTVFFYCAFGIANLFMVKGGASLEEKISRRANGANRGRRNSSFFSLNRPSPNPLLAPLALREKISKQKFFSIPS